MQLITEKLHDSITPSQTIYNMLGLMITLVEFQSGQ